MVTSEQVQAARVLLRWGQKELAATLKVSLPSIKRLENRCHPHSPRIGRRRIHRREWRRFWRAAKQNQTENKMTKDNSEERETGCRRLFLDFLIAGLWRSSMTFAHRGCEARLGRWIARPGRTNGGSKHPAAFMISASQLHVRLRSIRRSILGLRYPSALRHGQPGWRGQLAIVAIRATTGGLSLSRTGYKEL
jgi:hypothetical protein